MKELRNLVIAVLIVFAIVMIGTHVASPQTLPTTTTEPTFTCRALGCPNQPPDPCPVVGCARPPANCPAPIDPFGPCAGQLPKPPEQNDANAFPTPTTTQPQRTAVGFTG